ncbi:MAG: hypothetical protein ACXAD7_28700, partial [Candidatus Kariarchaeaceae archaeon]
MPTYVDIYNDRPSNVTEQNIRLDYNDAALTAAGVNEDSLAPWGFSQEEARWMEAPRAMYTLDTINNRMHVNITGIQSNVSYFAIGTGSEWSWADINNTLIMFEGYNEITNVTDSSLWIFEDK